MIGILDDDDDDVNVDLDSSPPLESRMFAEGDPETGVPGPGAK